MEDQGVTMTRVPPIPLEIVDRIDKLIALGHAPKAIVRTIDKRSGVSPGLLKEVTLERMRTNYTPALDRFIDGFLANSPPGVVIFSDKILREAHRANVIPTMSMVFRRHICQYLTDHGYRGERRKAERKCRFYRETPEKTILTEVL
jgi:hypothetical protein